MVQLEYKTWLADIDDNVLTNLLGQVLLGLICSFLYNIN